MKEIGGYFGLEELTHKEYYPDLIAVNNARNALLYILKAKKIRKLYIPYFLCDSVSKLCDREGYEYEYYHIGKDFMPIFDRELNESERIYIVNYYGQINNDKAIEFNEKYKYIIFDNVQAFFQKPVMGIDTIYSCRKFFGVPDGGYVFTDIRLSEDMSVDVSMNRMKHILGRYEGACASDYYSDFCINDESYYNLGLRYMSKLTHNILGSIDYEVVQKKREENYNILAELLGIKNELKLDTPIGPYAYPFYCKDGMNIKKQLSQNKIYVGTLWPNVLAMEESIEKDYAENIIPLPCDQRYGNDDMHLIYSTLMRITEHLKQ